MNSPRAGRARRAASGARSGAARPRTAPPAPATVGTVTPASLPAATGTTGTPRAAGTDTAPAPGAGRTHPAATAATAATTASVRTTTTTGTTGTPRAAGDGAAPARSANGAHREAPTATAGTAGRPRAGGTGGTSATGRIAGADAAAARGGDRTHPAGTTATAGPPTGVRTAGTPGTEAAPARSADRTHRTGRAAATGTTATATAAPGTAAGRALLVGVLPEWVAVSEAFGDVADAGLFPEEESRVARAIAPRRRAFATARHCARQALRRLGLPPVAIPSGLRGAPVWPAGVTGSLTHCAGYRAAAVSRSALAVGIDAEPHGPLPGRVLEFVATPGERRALRRVAAARPGVHFDRLLFSAKESVYKAWYPLTGRNLGFRDAEIVFRPDGTFHARLLVAGHRAGAVFVDGFAGRWVVDGGLLATAIAVPGTRTTDPERYPQGDLC